MTWRSRYLGRKNILEFAGKPEIDSTRVDYPHPLSGEYLLNAINKEKRLLEY